MGLKVIRDKEMGPKEKLTSAYEAIVLHDYCKAFTQRRASFSSQQKRFEAVWRVRIFSPSGIMLFLPGVRVLLFPPITLTRCKRLAFNWHCKIYDLYSHTLDCFLAIFPLQLAGNKDSFTAVVEVFWFSICFFSCISVALFSFSLYILFRVVKRIQLVPLFYKLLFLP